MTGVGSRATLNVNATSQNAKRKSRGALQYHMKWLRCIKSYILYQLFIVRRELAPNRAATPQSLCDDDDDKDTWKVERNERCVT